MKNKVFETDNFQLAAVLLCEGIALLSTDKANPKRVVFQFEDSQLREQITADFLSYRASIEPHKFFSAQRDLKQLIYR